MVPDGATVGGAPGATTGITWPPGMHKCQVCEVGYAYASFVADFMENALLEFYNMSSVATGFQMGKGRGRKKDFEHLHNKD